MEHFTNLLKWIEKNFNVKDLEFKDKTKFLDADFGMATDFNISGTFNNKKVLKYFLEEAEGAEFKGYYIGSLLLQKVFQFGIVWGQQIAEEKKLLGIGVDKKWNKNLHPDKWRN